jgi:hypothetical protein
LFSFALVAVLGIVLGVVLGVVLARVVLGVVDIVRAVSQVLSPPRRRAATGARAMLAWSLVGLAVGGWTPPTVVTRRTWARLGMRPYAQTSTKTELGVSGSLAGFVVVGIVRGRARRIGGVDDGVGGGRNDGVMFADNDGVMVWECMMMLAVLMTLVFVDNSVVMVW